MTLSFWSNTMAADTQKIFSSALALPPIDRASLIEQLLASFDEDVRNSIDPLWAEESESRLDAYDRGEIQAHDLAGVVALINKR